MAKSNETESPSINLIGAGTIIEGDIKSDGDIRIDGTLNGTLTLKGKLVLGQTCMIDGEVICQNADIFGTIKGKIKVSELLALKSTCKLTGDITTGKLSIEPGANFSGSCTMGNSVPNINLMSNNNLNAGQGKPAKQEKAVAC
ncbi:MAG: polymer-forming cytoskeletal protein [Bacteroidota bacterium]